MRTLAAEPGSGLPLVGSGAGTLFWIGTVRGDAGVPGEADVQRAILYPPETTRALIRGNAFGNSATPLSRPSGIMSHSGAVVAR